MVIDNGAFLRKIVTGVVLVKRLPDRDNLLYSFCNIAGGKSRDNF